MCTRRCHRHNSAGAPWREVLHVIGNNLDHYSWRLLELGREKKNHITLLLPRKTDTAKSQAKTHLEAEVIATRKKPNTYVQLRINNLSRTVSGDPGEGWRGGELGANVQSGIPASAHQPASPEADSSRCDCLAGAK